MRSTTVLLIGALLCVASSARACPFCSAQSQTLTEELNGADAAVLARLVGPVEGTKPAGSNPDSSPDTANRNTRFEIVRVLKGDKLLAGKKHIDVLYFGEQEPGTPFLMVAQDPKDLVWNTPTMLTARGVDYLPKLIKLPAAGSERMEFFLQHLEDEDPLLASDSYDEFARAPYADVTALKEKIDRPKLLGWIKSRDTSTSRRRLYLTLLGVCGKPEDLATLEGMIRDEDRSSRAALDALVACYLTLRGSEGLPLIEELFLANAKAEYVDTYATIMALRFLGQETKVVSKSRLAQSLRLMLKRPQLADLVISDLARWEDWSVMDQLVQMFKDAKDDTVWVRVPVISYLRACPLPEAKARIDELAKIDPDAVRRASSFFPLGSAASPPAGAQRPKEGAAKTDENTEKTQPAEQPGETKTEGAPAKATDKKTDKPAAAKSAAAERGSKLRAKSAGKSTSAGPAPSDVPLVSSSQVVSYAVGIGAALAATMAVVLYQGQPRT